MRRKMQLIFKLGLTFGVLFSVVMYYAINRETGGGEDKVNLNGHDDRKEGRVDRSSNLGKSSNSKHDLKDQDVRVNANSESVGSDPSSHVAQHHQPSGQDGGQVTMARGQGGVGNVDSVLPNSQLADHEAPLNPPQLAKTIDARDGTATQEQSGAGKTHAEAQKSKHKDTINLSVVVCGEHRLEETITMLKSARLLSASKLHFYIFTENELFSLFHAKLSIWPSRLKTITTYSLHPIEFPEMHNKVEWKKLFKPCAAQRLFIPKLLLDVDSVLYVDTDTLFLDSIDLVWQHFSRFNASQMAGVAPEHEDAHAGWYNRFARHPYSGPLGINSGVMLMNLTLMRNHRWLEKIVEYYREYRLKITWGDQDLINIYFHFYPHQLYLYPCEWNYRPDHCMYMSVCKTAEVNGIYVLHGNRGSFHNDKQPTFKAVYKAFKEFGNDMETYLVKQMEANLKTTDKTNCGHLGTMFSKRTKQYVHNRLR